MSKASLLIKQRRSILQHFLWLTIIFFTATPIEAQNTNAYGSGYTPPTPAELTRLRKMDVYHATNFIAPNQRAMSIGIKHSRMTLQGVKMYSYPTAVDLSMTGYLPPVKSQGFLNSCSAFAITYYYKTYQECREHGWDPSSVEHQMSPAFIFNQFVRGDTTPGTSLSLPAMNLCYLGCAPWSDMPYNGSDCNSFPSEAAWRHAVSFRGQSFSVLDLANREVLVENIKQNLANGDPVAFGINEIGTYLHNYNGGHGAGWDNDVIYDMVGTRTGGHALTLIGYDDTKSFNDGTGTKTGAFKVVNSWGKDWGLGGFAWIAYDIIRNSPISEVIILEDRNNYNPMLLGSIRIIHPNVYTLSLGWARQGSEKVSWARQYLLSDVTSIPDYSWLTGQDNICLLSGGTRTALDGTQAIVVDLSDGYHPGDQLSNWFAWVADGLGGTNQGRVTSVALEVTTGTLTSLDTPQPTRDPKTQGGLAMEVPLANPDGIALGPDGTLYLAEWAGSRVRKIKDGNIYDFAGKGPWGYDGDDGPAINASLYCPEDVAVDSQGRVYIADTWNNCIRCVEANGTIRTIISGLHNPLGIDFDGSGSLYIADCAAHKILKYDPDGSLHSFAGDGNRGLAGDEGLATSAMLNSPTDVSFNPADGNIYIADTGNAIIRRVTPDGKIHAFIGPINFGFYFDQRITCSQDGTIYYTTRDSNMSVYKIPLGGSAQLFKTYTPSVPQSIAIDATGNIFISLVQGNNWIEKVEPSGNATRIAGLGPFQLSGYGNPLFIHMDRYQVPVELSSFTCE